jgi:hypothetical protein
MSSHRLLKFLRAVHLYLGVFTAPALLFFAFTGALQTFDLHETARSSDYKPPAWLQAMSHLHKKESLDVPVRRAPADAASRGAAMRDSTACKADALQVCDAAPALASGSTAARSDSADAKARAQGDRASNAPRRNLLPMKIYFALVAASLFLSTLTGVYMASRMSRSARRIAATFSAGIIVPLLLLMV